MKKNGFTLVELLVVIAIIGILSIIIIPSVINVNKNVNNRLYDSKKEHITTAAKLYASRNDDIFNGVDEVQIYVFELIDLGYVEIDMASEVNNARCNESTSHGVKGCVLNPIASGTLNYDYVIIRKQGAAGYYTEYHPSDDAYSEGEGTSVRTLVEAVCTAFENKTLTGKTTGGKNCKCFDESTSKPGYDTIKEYDLSTNTAGSEVNACIISGENPNNYLRYGDSQPNWRVLGVYKLGTSNEYPLSAKIITSEPI